MILRLTGTNLFLFPAFRCRNQFAKITPALKARYFQVSGKPRKILALVVRSMDKAIDWINLYPVDSAVCFAGSYPLNSDLSVGWRYSAPAGLCITGPWTVSNHRPIVITSTNVDWILHHVYRDTVQEQNNMEFTHFLTITLRYGVGN